MQPVKDMQARIYGKCPKASYLGGEKVDFTKGEGYVEFTIKASAHEVADLTYQLID